MPLFVVVAALQTGESCKRMARCLLIPRAVVKQNNAVEKKTFNRKNKNRKIM